jgi:hypothetical protein
VEMVEVIGCGRYVAGLDFVEPFVVIVCVVPITLVVCSISFQLEVDEDCFTPVECLTLAKFMKRAVAVDAFD